MLPRRLRGTDPIRSTDPKKKSEADPGLHKRLTLGPWESFQRQMNYYSWFAERGRAGGDAFVCADPAVRHAADFERRLRRRSTQYR